MSIDTNPRDEIFSYHLVKLPFFNALRFLLFPPKSSRIPGLKYSLCLFTMNLGQDVFSFSRYKFNTLAFIARWSNEGVLDQFLREKLHPFSRASAWHLRMRPYRRWGSFTGLDEAHIFEELQGSVGPVVGLTVARLRLLQARRFTKWGKPVESQVQNHKGKNFAVVSMRPLQIFSTFSIWENEMEMLSMVNGSKKQLDGMNHKKAMQERARKPFHHEFTTMRFQIFKEFGRLDSIKTNILNNLS